MWQLLNGLVSSFLLVRDAFGYLLPGALFVLGLIYTCSIRYRMLVVSVTDVFRDTPRWLLIWFLVGAAYALGHVLAAMGYQFYEWLEFIPGIGPRDRKKAKAEAVERGRQLALYRYLYPSLFIDRDRRDTVNILRIGLAMTFLALAAILPIDRVFQTALWIVGLFMSLNGRTGRRHVDAITDTTIWAAQEARKLQVPYFQWSAGGIGKSRSGD